MRRATWVIWVTWVTLICLLWPITALSEPVSLLRPSGQAWDFERQPLVLHLPKPLTGALNGAEGRGSSLFAGQAEGSFFEPLPPRPEGRRALRALRGAPEYILRIREIIGRAESPRDGYDAVQHGATRRPVKKPSQMSLGEIFAWIEATPGQPHAIGYYQFIPSTLARLVTELELGPQVIFTPAVQDQLANLLLADAGLLEWRRGEMSQRAFMANLAKIWAGLPMPSGKSHYHGYAGNKATMTWAEFERAMPELRPG